MSIDPMEALILHFSYFMTGKLSREDWETVTKEFGTGQIAADTKRFYRSKFFSDDDEAKRTIQFLETVREEDEQVAMSLMKRAYEMTDGADDEELERYPSLTVLEQEDTDRGPVVLPSLSAEVEPFLDLQNVPGTFYPDLINDINRCHRLGIYDASLVLTRKLLENLLIDVLRSQYGTEKIDLYYDTNRRQFQPFHKLVINLENNLDEFEHLSTELNKEFIDDLNVFRQTANRSAHSLEVDISDEKIETYAEKATRISRILFRVRDLI
jgi:hypothetical protein